MTLRVHCRAVRFVLSGGQARLLPLGSQHPPLQFAIDCRTPMWTTSIMGRLPSFEEKPPLQSRLTGRRPLLWLPSTEEVTAVVCGSHCS